MDDKIIQVNGLGKQYRIASIQQRYGTLRDAMADGARRSLGRIRSLLNGGAARQDATETLWALRDVSFEIKRGEAVGIIGRNGAGKSTLLKILSRITEPTEGIGKIDGRVGSLLEVGTGFHQELTGRENIFLNGAILGMRKSDISRRFPDIVEFAQIEKFIDTPVKFYSTGMYLRLAFAVAAHLEPDILIVDEVLAVGDAQFQKKCLGKMQNVTQELSRTVLFVSHNMNAIQRLCSRCLMLEEGRLVADGDTETVVSRYLTTGVFASSPGEWIDMARVNRNGTGQARFVAARYTSLCQTAGFHPYPEGPLEFMLAIDSDSRRSIGTLGVCIYDQQGTRLVNADSILLGATIQLEKGRNEIKVRIESLHLTPGVYVAALWLAQPTGTIYDHIESAFEIEVIDLEPRRLGMRDQGHGAVTCQFEISTAAVTFSTGAPTGNPSLPE